MPGIQGVVRAKLCIVMRPDLGGGNEFAFLAAIARTPQTYELPFAQIVWFCITQP